MGRRGWGQLARCRQQMTVSVFVLGEKQRCEAFELTAYYCRAQIGHKVLVKGQIVPSQKHRSDDFIRLDGVMQISATKLQAGRATTLFIEGGRIVDVAGIAQIQCTVAREGLAVASRTRWQHAVEHIDASDHSANNVIRFANTHQIARLIEWQMWNSGFQGVKHDRLPFPDSKTADGITIEFDFPKIHCGALAQLRKDPALHYSKTRATLLTTKRRLRPPSPAHR